jgi:L-threonylcarbamoyladenylate synthase
MDYQTRTTLLKLDAAAPDPDVIAQAAAILRSGGLVAFPTETVYGLGANALDGEAIDRIFRAKRRPYNDPLITHIVHPYQINLLAVDLPPYAMALAEAFWPGPLTLVLKRAPGVPDNLASGMATVAVRMPIHPVAQALIRAAGVPVAAPSANTFTRPSATTAAHVLEDLYGRVDMVLDGGPTPLGLESTVVDLTCTPPVILRPGGLVLNDLRRIAPDISMRTQHLTENDAPSGAPGQMLKHYAPRARLMLYDGSADDVRAAITDTTQRYIANGRRVGILTVAEDAEHYNQLGARIIALGARGDDNAIGRLLFGALRALDGQAVDVILAPLLGSGELGDAIRDRLIRAAEGRVYTITAP